MSEEKQYIVHKHDDDVILSRESLKELIRMMILYHKGITEPDNGDPGTTDPGTTDPGTTDPGTTDPGTTDPGTTDPGTTDPGTTDPGNDNPGTTDPGNYIDINDCSISVIANFIYDGHTHSPTVTVKYNNQTLTKGTHYNIDGIVSAVNGGIYYITIIGIETGGYTGTSPTYTWMIGKASRSFSNVTVSPSSTTVGTETNLVITGILPNDIGKQFKQEFDTHTEYPGAYWISPHIDGLYYSNAYHYIYQPSDDLGINIQKVSNGYKLTLSYTFTSATTNDGHTSFYITCESTNYKASSESLTFTINPNL